MAPLAEGGGGGGGWVAGRFGVINTMEWGVETVEEPVLSNHDAFNIIKG